MTFYLHQSGGGVPNVRVKHEADQSQDSSRSQKRAKTTNNKSIIDLMDDDLTALLVPFNVPDGAKVWKP